MEIASKKGSLEQLQANSISRSFKDPSDIRRGPKLTASVIRELLCMQQKFFVFSPRVECSLLVEWMKVEKNEER